MNMEYGFSFIELIIVIAIIAVIGVVAVPFYSRFLTQNAVANTVNQLTQELRKAQTYSMTGKQNSNWGVNYANNTITLYKGTSYSTRSTAFDETFSFPSTISISSGGGVGSLVQDATSISGNSGSTSTLSWSHTVGNGSNTILIVGLVTNNTTTYTGVTWNTNQALTHLGSTLNCPIVDFSYGCHVDIWYRLSPTAGTHTIAATSSVATNNSGGAVSYANIDQTTPFGTASTATGSTSSNQSVSVAVSSLTANQVILGVLGTNNTTTNGTGTSLWNDHFAFYSMGESNPGTGGSVNMDWNVNSGDWGAIGVPLNPASTSISDINFYRLTGTASASPTITIAGSGNTKTIAINTQGVVNTSGGSSSGYLFKKSITVNHAKVIGGADLSNFPVLISMIDTNLKTVANGGSVQNANGFDIIFKNAAETVQLDHEIEKYVPSTGEVDMWVRLPTLSSSTDTTIYMYYDNSAIASSQENKTGVWNSNYLSVYHMNDNAANTTVAESTLNANTGTNVANTSIKTTTGQIANALTYNGTTDVTSVGTGGSVKGDTKYTISAWFTVTAFTTANKMQLYSECTNVSGTTRLNFGLTQASPGQITLNGRVADADGLTTFVTNSTTLSTGTWYYASAVFDSTSATNNMHLMLNGVDQTASLSKSAIANTTPGHVIEIGAHCAGASEFWNGKIDELRLSNTARTAGWNTTEYNNLNSPSTFYTVSAPIAQ